MSGVSASGETALAPTPPPLSIKERGWSYVMPGNSIHAFSLSAPVTTPVAAVGAATIAPEPTPKGIGSPSPVA